ncbi:hypothetical protein GCM10010390_87500 [Streptomyces mordarskii]|uniref:Uncharacterized protein n=1 Tax=Streptomyces mordarskii TaxID=1226758 RepID=A0ABP3PTJ7_9ACTN
MPSSPMKASGSIDWWPNCPSAASGSPSASVNGPPGFADLATPMDWQALKYIQ